MALAPDASLHCTAESNLARSLSSSRSRRARENPSLQSHVEYEERPETREREMLGFKASGSGGGAVRAGNRPAGRREIKLAGEGEGGMGNTLIEQADGRGVGNLAVRAGLEVFPFERCSLLSGSGSRRGSGNPKKRRILPSEDEVRAAAADWPTLGATLRRALGAGRGGDAAERARFSSGGDEAGAVKAGEEAREKSGEEAGVEAGEKAGAERARAGQTEEQGQGGLVAAPVVTQKDKGTLLQQQAFNSRFEPGDVTGKGDAQKTGKPGTGPGEKASHECRFCGKEFGSFRALGGHMNLHRRERKVEEFLLLLTLLERLMQIPLRLYSLLLILPLFLPPSR
ncbi:unnamed protein product [Closterium sp. NIES-65]|nr:unnamed protein product [Closterium sp. NIES-65]